MATASKQARENRAPAREREMPPAPNVLVVDDNVGLADLWAMVLEDAGYTVRTASNGAGALKELSQREVDVAVLDLQLPDLSGLDVFSAIRADLPDAEGILITGHASTESAVDAVNRGLYGYLMKPVSPDMLRLMVNRAVERQRLLRERDAQRRELEAAYRREHHIAETLQRSLLPELNVQLPGVEVAYLYQAAMAEAKVGGDFYDVVELPEGRVGVVLGDVSGKGLDAAVYTALTKYTLRSYALEDPCPERVLRRLNRAFYQQSSEETFATLFYGVLDLVPGCLTYASAGHEPGMLHDEDSGKVSRLPSTGPAAGVLPEADFVEVSVSFGDHSSLLLYTDGASDARRGDAFLGAEGIEEILKARIGPNLRETLASIYQDILQYSRYDLRDDTALLLVRRRPVGTASP